MTSAIEAPSTSPAVRVTCGACRHPFHVGACHSFGCRCETGAPPEGASPPAQTFVLVVSRHGRRLDELEDFLLGAGVLAVPASTYTYAATLLDSARFEAVVFDVLGVLPGEDDMSPERFSDLLQERAVPAVYLVAGGARASGIVRRHPQRGVRAPVVRKPVRERSLLEALRAVIPLRHADHPGAYFDAGRNEVVSAAGAVRLTRTEARLLAVMAQRRGQSVSSVDLMRDALGYVEAVSASTLIRAHMHNLRAKLAAVGLDDAIWTYRGRGYCLRDDLEIVGF
jgi:DNA-binding response OmpR family regulator